MSSRARRGCGRELNVLENTPPWEWPEDAARTLASVLGDRGASGKDRLLAARLAGEFCVMDDDLAETLLAVVRDGAEAAELRGRAAISFGPVLENADTEGFEDALDLPISERTFRSIQGTLRTLYQDDSVSKEARRRFLEASVRAPEEWHAGAIRAAHASGDAEWVLTAVFCMGYVSGFDQEILAALDSDDPRIRYQAVCAAGSMCLDEAWPRVAALAAWAKADKALLLAAIEAVASIRPGQAGEVLGSLLDSADQDVVEAVEEALSLAEAMGGDLDDEEEEDEEDDDEEDEEDGEDPRC